MKGWQFWLIRIPALIVDIWCRVYVVLMAAAALATVAILTIVLLLAAFGIRWGW